MKRGVMIFSLLFIILLLSMSLVSSELFLPSEQRSIQTGNNTDWYYIAINKVDKTELIGIDKNDRGAIGIGEIDGSLTIFGRMWLVPAFKHPSNSMWYLCPIRNMDTVNDVTDLDNGWYFDVSDSDITCYRYDDPTITGTANLNVKVSLITDSTAKTKITVNTTVYDITPEDTGFGFLFFPQNQQKYRYVYINDTWYDLAGVEGQVPIQKVFNFFNSNQEQIGHLFDWTDMFDNGNIFSEIITFGSGGQKGLLVGSYNYGSSSTINIDPLYQVDYSPIPGEYLISGNVTADDSQFTNITDITTGISDNSDTTTYEVNIVGEIVSTADTMLLYHFNNDSNYGENDTFAYDFSSYENNGQISGAYYIDGKYGKALNFDGTDDYVNAGSDVSLNITGEGITVMAWIYPTASADKDVIVKNGAYTLKIDRVGANLFSKGSIFSGSTEYTAISTTAMNLNEWYHIVMVYRGSYVYLYQDGVQEGQSTQCVFCKIDGNNNNITIAGDINYFQGRIDEVVIINESLNLGEIQNYYSGKSFGKVIVGKWSQTYDSIYNWWLRLRKTTSGSANVIVYAYYNNSMINTSQYITKSLDGVGWFNINVSSLMNYEKNTVGLNYTHLRFFSNNSHYFSEMVLRKEADDVENPVINWCQINDTYIESNEFTRLECNVTDDVDVDYVNGTINSISYNFIKNGDLYYYDFECTESTDGINIWDLTEAVDILDNYDSFNPNLNFTCFSTSTNLVVFASKNPVEILEEYIMYANYTRVGQPILNATCYGFNSSVVGGGQANWGRGVIDIGGLSTVDNAIHTQVPDIYGNNTIMVQIQGVPLNKTGYGFNYRFHVHNEHPADDLRVYANCNNSLSFDEFILIDTVEKENAIVSDSNESTNTTIWGFRNKVVFGFPMPTSNCSIMFESYNTSEVNSWMVADTISTLNLNNAYYSDDFGETYTLRDNADTRSPFVDMAIGLSIPNETTMTYNSTLGLYILENIRHGRPFTFHDQVICSADGVDNATGYVDMIIQDNVVPLTQIVSINPDSSIILIDNVTIHWSANDAELLESFINIRYPNGSLLIQSEIEPIIINSTYLSVLGNYSVQVFANDTTGLSSTANGTFEVVQNTAPTFDEALTNQTVSTIETLNYDINCSDVNNHHIITYYDNATLFDINSVTGLISDSPTESDVGSYDILITCGDGIDNTSQTFTYTVTDVTSPVITDCQINDTYIMEDEVVRLRCNVTDGVGVDKVNFTISSTVFETTNIGDWYYYDYTCLENNFYNWNLVEAWDLVGNYGSIVPNLNFTCFIPILTNLSVFPSKNPVEILEEYVMYANFTDVITGQPILNATCYGSNSSVVGGGQANWGRGVIDIGGLSTVGNAIHTQTPDIWGNNTIMVRIENVPLNKTGYGFNFRFNVHEGHAQDDLRVYANCNNSLSFDEFTLIDTVDKSDGIICMIEDNDSAVWGFRNKVIFGFPMPTSNCSIMFESYNTSEENYWKIADTISTLNLNNAYYSDDYGETYILRNNSDTRSPFVDMAIGLSIPNETTMTYNSTTGLYFLDNIRHGRPFTFRDKVICSADGYENATSYVDMILQDNVPPITQIISINPDPSIILIDNVTVHWAVNDAELLASFISVNYPNGSLLMQSEDKPLIINALYLTVIGNYSVVVFANDTGGLSSTANGTFEAVCTPNIVNTSWSNWENIECLIDDTMNQSRYRIEYDDNYCGEIGNITYTEYRDTEYCNYCSEDLVGPFYNPENCPDSAPYVWEQYYIDNNYDVCCEITGLFSDCSILYSPYTNTTVDCSPLVTDIEIDIDETVYLDDRMYFMARINESNSTKCWSYIKKEGKILQTNPQKTEYTTSLLLRKETEDREYFTPIKGRVNAYWTDQNVIPYDEFVLGLKCTLDNGSIITGEKHITHMYQDLRRVTSRSVWGAKEMSMLVIVIVITLFVLGLLIYAWKK